MSKCKKYPQKFRNKWLSDDFLNTWLSSVPEDDSKAFCRYCQCFLNAKYANFKQHVSSRKHKYSCQFSNRITDSDVINCEEKYSNHDIFHYNVGQSGYITLKHVEMASTNGVSEVASSDVTKAQPSEQVVGEILCPITFNSTDTESESTNHQIIEALIDAGRQPVSQSADITPSLEHGYTLQNSVSVPKILLCCTGSVASVKVPQLVKLLSSMQCRPEVKLVTTKSALHFFSLMSVGCQTYTDGNEWELWRELKDPVLHIQLRHWADLLVISPLDANTLAKIAHGICDNLLTCVVRSWDVKRPLLFAPAMSTHMWQHAITARQLGILRSFGYVEIPSVRKKLAHSNKDVCAMAELETIVKEVEIVLLES